MTTAAPCCPCCGNRWLDDAPYALLGNSFVAPSGWCAMSPRQARILRELLTGRVRKSDLARRVGYVSDNATRLLQSQIGATNQLLRVIGWEITTTASSVDRPDGRADVFCEITRVKLP